MCVDVSTPLAITRFSITAVSSRQTMEELEAINDLLNHKGLREKAFKKNLTRHKARIQAAMNKRARLGEAVLGPVRRSTRSRQTRMGPYVAYVNKWA